MKTKIIMAGGSGFLGGVLADYFAVKGMRTIRMVSHARFGLPAPLWLLEIGAFFLRTETELLIKSRRVIPGKLLASGFNFRHPHLKGAVEQLTS